MDSGRVQAGATVRLETVPVPFLQQAPLVEGEWLDYHLAELAEWGALVQAKGYAFKETEDDHPLASARFARADGGDADQVDILALRVLAVDNMTKFPGRSRKINKRLGFCFQDYCAWQGRKVKGDLSASVQQGFLTASWNTWVDSCGSERAAVVAGVPVTRLPCYIERYPRWIPTTGAQQELRRRERLLDDLRKWHCKPGGEADLVQDWRDAVEAFLFELYSFDNAVACISKRYFDGVPLLFPDLAEDLARVVGDTEKLVEVFDGIFAATDQRARISLEDVRNSANENAAGRIIYFVDMAKSDALEQMGEEQASMELAGRHL